MAEAELRTDAELLKQLIDGNYRAFTAIYNRYSVAVKQFILKILKSAELNLAAAVAAMGGYNSNVKVWWDK